MPYDDYPAQVRPQVRPRGKWKPMGTRKALAIGFIGGVLTMISINLLFFLVLVVGQ